MSERRRAWWIFLSVFVVVLILGSVLATLLARLMRSPQDQVFGVTFSHIYAQQLHLDWEAVYGALLNDLQVKRVRLPVPWSAVEAMEGEEDYRNIDLIMDHAGDLGVQVTLVIGYKVPRWPECFIPDWAETRSIEDRRAAAMDVFEETILRYRDHPALTRWQVENEPFFFYGECPWPDATRVRDTIALVRELDPEHEVMQTMSGEQSAWIAHALRADVAGVSLYRVAYNSVLGYVVFPLRPYFYQAQRLLALTLSDQVIISELQAEPWLSAPQSSYDVADLYAQFTVEDFVSHVDFAKRTGASEIFLWGGEWWYYLKDQGDDRLWEYARTLFE